jgi:hypothetical protein
MTANQSANVQNLIIEDENSVLMFEEESTILVKKFKEKIFREISYHFDKNACYGQIISNHSPIGQIDKLDWVYYPTNGKNCQLLILGEKNWKKGVIKIYGNCVFNVFDDCEESRNLASSESHKWRKINVVLEFIPEITEPEIEVESESPLDEIRKGMNSI